MSEKFITIADSVKKYNLNNSKFVLAIRRAAYNGLYKVIYRKRTRIYLRQDFLEEWLKENDVHSPCLPNKGRPRKILEEVDAIQELNK